MASEQVAQVLRSAGTNVKLLVARQKSNRDSYTDQPNFSSLSTTEATIELTKDDHDESIEVTFDTAIEKDNEEEHSRKENEEENDDCVPLNKTNQNDDNELDDQEVETIEVELVKDKKGLGITIAGYICEKEDISGIYVKSIAPGSAADLSGKIQINDQIIEIGDQSLLEFTNHEAVEVLRKISDVVKIKLARYLKGGKFDRLQLAISNADFNVIKPQISTKRNQTILHVNSEKSSDLIDNVTINEKQKESVLMDLEKIREYWENEMGDDYEIVIATFSKFEENGGLGISLEGTIEEEIGKEPRPHHYIESILKQGPVGLNDVLRPKDEILQCNNTKIYNMEHTEVVRFLKELPINVCMICARLKSLQKNIINLIPTIEDNTIQSDQQNLYDQYISSTISQERLVKAKSDGSLAIVNSVELLSKMKSRSLEPMTGLAMWNSNPVIIELLKGDRGLGFSILDYQNPVNPNETVIVIRSLVQGGVAQQNGDLIPGDRLVSVNEFSLENASLDLAVQALKGAPKGLVRLLVAKPLTISEQERNKANSTHELIDFTSTYNNLNMPVPLLSQDDGEIEQQSDNKSDQARQDSDWRSVDIDDDFERADYLLRQKHLENFDKSYFDRDDSILINRSRSYSPLSMQFESNYIDDIGYTEIPIPSDLERLIVLQKKNQSLGITLELSEHGINGLILRSLTKRGLIARDGHIQCGDNLLAINNESLRNTTTSKAKAIFKRVSLVNGQIPVKYVPELEAQCYRRNASFEKSKSQRSLPCFKQYCRTPSPTQRVPSTNPFF